MISLGEKLAEAGVVSSEDVERVKRQQRIEKDRRRKDRLRVAREHQARAQRQFDSRNRKRSKKREGEKWRGDPSQQPPERIMETILTLAAEMTLASIRADKTRMKGQHRED